MSAIFASNSSTREATVVPAEGLSLHDRLGRDGLPSPVGRWQEHDGQNADTVRRGSPPKAIVDALRRRDGKRAAQYMDHHLQHIEAQIDLTDHPGRADFTALFKPVTQTS